MKKLGLMILVAGIVLMAGCAGDDPAGPGGTLPTVTGLEILTTSTGRTVNLSWTAVTGTDIDGYEVYIKNNGSGSWTKIDDVTGTTYTHTADNSGIYSVRAYKDDNFSENYSNEKTTMPNQIQATYTIWDNHAPIDSTSGFDFGENSGTRVLAASSNAHDIYCFDGSWSESPCGFYSGNVTPFGTGHPTNMSDAGSTYGYPSGAWWPTGYIVAGDVIFCELDNGHYVKVYVSAVPVCPAQSASHGVTFYYDYQLIEGLYLFTTESS